MSLDRKVTFRLSIGYVGAEHVETMTLEEMGITEEDFNSEKELQEILDREWEDWCNNYIDGGAFLDDEGE